MDTITRHLPLAARILLGLTFLVFGLNGFLQFLPAPAPQGLAAQFVGGLAASQYFFPLLKGLEVIAGIALLSGRFVPLALAVLAPIVVNILAFHVFVAGSGLALPLVLLALELVLAWSYRDAFAPMLRSKVEPRVGSSATPKREPATV